MAAKTKYNNTAKNCSTFFTLALAHCLIFFGSFSCWFEHCVPKKKKKMLRFMIHDVHNVQDFISFFLTSRPAQLHSSRSQSGYNSMWNPRTEKEDGSLERRGHAEKNEALHVVKEINWARDMPTLIFTVGTCLHYFSPCLVDSIHTVHHPIR